jgi:hypothetical protein
MQIGNVPIRLLLKYASVFIKTDGNSWLRLRTVAFRMSADARRSVCTDTDTLFRFSWRRDCHADTFGAAVFFRYTCVCVLPVRALALEPRDCGRPVASRPCFVQSSLLGLFRVLNCPVVPLAGCRFARNC